MVEWGPEYDDALGSMRQLTSVAVDRCEASQSNMTTAIQTQVDMLFG